MKDIRHKLKIAAWPAWRKFCSFSRRTQYAFLAAVVIGTMLPVMIGGQHASASTMGPYSPTAGASVAGSGTAWTNPSNVKVSDGADATVSLGASAISYYLEATGYGFSIPATATINGIQVSVTRYASNTSVQDNAIQLLQSGTTPVGQNETGGSWPTSSGVANYGSTSDLWALSWTPSQINASTFGVALSAKNSCTLLCTYTANVDYISVTVTYTVPTAYNQASYRWMQNSVQSFPISEHISSGSNYDIANSVAVDHSGGYMYVAGYDENTASSKSEWRIEKRSLSTGALSYGVSEHISSANDGASSIAIDTSGGYMYVAGYDENTTSNFQEWRIEKRNLSDGSLISSFGTYGAATEHISSQNDQANTLAIDPTGGYMYVAGYDENTTSNHNEWRMEKRSLGTGALSYGVSEHISSANDSILSIAIDTSGGFMYMAGFDENTTSNFQEWRIEKRNLSDGSFVSAFGTSGAATEHISNAHDAATAIAIDPTGGYMYVAGADENTASNYSEWRMEKRSLGTGALSYGVSEHISSSNDNTHAIAIDPVSGYMYVAGYDYNGPGTTKEWRIEKRNLSDGSFVSAFGTSGAISEHISRGAGFDEAYSLAIDTSSGNMYVAGYDSNQSGYPDEWRLESRSLSTGNPPSATVSTLAAANTAITSPAGAFRLRLLLGVSTTALAASGQNFQLAEAQMSSGTCATQTYSTVVSSTSPIAFFNNPNPTDGMAMSTSPNDPTDGSNPVEAQDYLASNTYFTNGNSAIGVGQDGEWDISLYNYSAAPGTTWCFEVQKSGGGALDTYTVYPQLTTATTSFNQASYRWMQNTAPSIYPISEAASTGGSAYATAIDPTGGYMYMVGSDYPSGGGRKEWRIEKRSLATGVLNPRFGTNGTVLEDISTYDDEAQAIAIDPTGGYMYVVGYDQTQGTGHNEWRIEKRSLTTGALSYGVSEALGAFYNIPIAIAVDPTGGYMYVAGYDDISSGGTEWRIEKRNLSDGSFVSGFGTTGALTEHISTQNDEADTIAIDPSSGNMYVAGYDDNSSNKLNEWRIEKRSLTTGALSYGVSEHISNSFDVADAIAIDPSGGYMYLAGQDQSTGQEWRIEKRLLSTGALSYGVSEHISSASDSAYSIAIDPAGGYMYVAGYDENTPSNYQEWRIEKRLLSTGALSYGVSEHISSASDSANAIAIDPAGGYMYVVGSDDNATPVEWRIESRIISTGSTYTVPATPLLASNTSTNQFHPGDIVRLRIIIGVAGSMIAGSGQAFKLQEAASNGSCSNSLNYNDVTTSSGGVRFYTGNNSMPDGSTMVTSANDPSDGYNTLVGQDYLASNSYFTNNQSALRPTQDGEWDIALQVAATNIGGFCFRVVKSSGSLLDTYNNFPSLGVHALPNQRLYHGKQLVTGSLSGLDSLIP